MYDFRFSCKASTFIPIDFFLRAVLSQTLLKYLLDTLTFSSSDKEAFNNPYISLSINRLPGN